MTGKLKGFPFLFAFLLLLGCKTGQVNDPAAPAAGMFKVAILYPNGEGKTFDMDYYEKKHMPMVARMLGSNLKFYEIDKGLTGRTPTDPVPFLAIGFFYIRDVAAYNQAVAQNREAIVADFKNYTNIQPVIQVSQIRQLVEYKSVK